MRHNRSVKEVLNQPLEGLERDSAILDLVAAELVAARAAELHGGGSPCWTLSVPAPGEELCLAIEVAKAINEHRWPPLNPYPAPTSLS